MSLIEWRDDFRIGIAEVDHEHRELIELINELYSGLGSERTDDGVERCLGEIYARISAHFALEEKVMADRGYRDFQPHKADHERLLDSILDIMDEHAAQGVLDDAGFGKRLAEWFGGHFRTHDARLHRFLNQERRN
jgi:hemerythrin-like metal-binding protein